MASELVLSSIENQTIDDRSLIASRSHRIRNNGATLPSVPKGPIDPSIVPAHPSVLEDWGLYRAGIPHPTGACPLQIEKQRFIWMRRPHAQRTRLSPTRHAGFRTDAAPYQRASPTRLALVVPLFEDRFHDFPA